jgi:pyruvate/2-oxoglutarate dehydrogenase complex dihydrolipoamide acyltransferase (E2) component
MILQLAQSLVAPVTGILDKLIEEKDQKAAMAHEIATIADKQANEQAKAQIQLNAVEAAHTSMFVAGWRPSIGWVCSLAMLMNFILLPLINAGLEFGGVDLHIDLIDMETMMPVLFGMLGLGGMRTAEKIKGVQREK